MLRSTLTHRNPLAKRKSGFEKDMKVSEGQHTCCSITSGAILEYRTKVILIYLKLFLNVSFVTFFLRSQMTFSTSSDI